jgi:hypothetical protein
MFAHVHGTGLAYYAHGGNWIKLAPLNAPDFTGGIDVTGQIKLGDGSGSGGTNKISFGAGDDLNIYHDGSDSYIVDSGTGDLMIRSSDDLKLQNADGSETYLHCNTDGDVILYRDGGEKLRTTAQGISVTGLVEISGTVDGRDVAADGTKLDGIESGATADQTGAEIASALNGQNIYTTGFIGRDSNDAISFSNNAHMDIKINGSTEFRFEADGDFHADGDVIAQSTTISSDRRLKENIEVIPNALDKVQALDGVSFDWKKTGEKSAGVIAQEVQKVLPEAVKEVTPVGGGDSHLTVNYHALTSILIESIKELKAEIEQLKGGE